MEDQVLVNVRARLAKVAENRAEMNRAIGKIWAVGGSIILILIITLCGIAFFAK